ncbi:hypothetical protein ACWGB8_27790 [Kitasatospora sp. NPDC054939]
MTLAVALSATLADEPPAMWSEAGWRPAQWIPFGYAVGFLGSFPARRRRRLEALGRAEALARARIGH